MRNRQRVSSAIIGILLICMFVFFSVSGSAEYSSLAQTIPDSLNVYLPMIIKQEQPTATPTVAPTLTPTQAATLVPTLTPMPTSRPNCDPSYPTVCIPPPPPDLDCKHIPYRRFKVLPPDPHGFDGNHDGIGCER